MKNNKKKSIAAILLIVSIVIIVLIHLNLGLIHISGIDGENNYLHYEGRVVNGGVFKQLGDPRELDWLIRNKGDYIIDNWLVWSRIEMPDGEVITNTYYGSDAMEPDDEVYVTTDLGGFFDVEGGWLMKAVTFEGDLFYLNGTLYEEGAYIDRVDDEDIYVAYNLIIDKSSNVQPDEINEGDAVIISYSATNKGDASIGLCIQVFADKNQNHKPDLDENKFVDICKEPCPVNDGISSFVMKPLTIDDTIDGVNASICIRFIAYDFEGTVPNPDLIEYDDYIIKVLRIPPDIGITFSSWIIIAAAGAASIAAIVIIFRKSIFKI